MIRYTLCSIVLSTVAMLSGCNGSSTTQTMNGDPLCTRQRDIEQRCTPARGACLFQADYDSCVANEGLYRPERTAAYLTCYPDDIGCDSTSSGNASQCVLNAADKVAVTSALTMLANDLCQRCAGYAGDGVTDVNTCVMNTTTNQTPTAQTLRLFTDDTLNKLGTCLRKASPPADGCVAYSSCYMNLFTPVSTGSCKDGGA